MNHLLDRAIWTSLTTRQAALAQSAGEIRRFDPDFAPFAATADASAMSLANLAELVPLGGNIVLQQTESMAPPPGLVIICTALTVQMVAERIEGDPAVFPFEELGDADAPAMRALAALTKPGPFSARTHELGRFVGVRHEGRLVAMAGERLKAGPFTEVSSVCTHPEHRGHGYAAGLMREVGRGILERGETPFLHAFADNVGAIGLYERLGFVTRWQPILTVFERA